MPEPDRTRPRPRPDTVAYQLPDLPGALMCPEHGDALPSPTPLASGALPYSGFCAWGTSDMHVCGRALPAKPRGGLPPKAHRRKTCASPTGPSATRAGSSTERQTVRPQSDTHRTQRC